MNRYILIRRLMGPAILLLLGSVALLHQADLVSWNIFVPLLLILIGVLKLAERAALAAADDEPLLKGAYPGPYAGTASQYAGTVVPQTPPQAEATNASVPPQDFGRGPEGGQS